MVLGLLIIQLVHLLQTTDPHVVVGYHFDLGMPRMRSPNWFRCISLVPDAIVPPRVAIYPAAELVASVLGAPSISADRAARSWWSSDPTSLCCRGIRMG